MEHQFNSFQEFYPFYLSQHQHPICRLLHVIGTFCVICIFLTSFNSPQKLLLMPVIGYGFAWVGHFMFEKNKPATFKNPIYSLIGDFYMFLNIITGKEKINL